MRVRRGRGLVLPCRTVGEPGGAGDAWKGLVPGLVGSTPHACADASSSAGPDSNELLPTGGGACYQVHYRRATGPDREDRPANTSNLSDGYLSPHR